MLVDISLHCVGERNIFQTVLLSFFFQLSFSMPSKFIITVIELIENDHLGDWSPEKDCCW